MGLPKMPQSNKGAKNLPISLLVQLDEGFLIITKPLKLEMIKMMFH
mgnify:CR=1 FL=1